LPATRREGEHQQERRIEDDRGDVQPGLGNAVVGGFSVRFEADFVGKGGGNRVLGAPIYAGRGALPATDAFR